MGGCFNGTIDESNYSTTIPFVGLYIAVATLVCLLLMILDIVSGIRSRKTWLPCRYFSLNAVILTLLSIIAKIPGDTSTSMPTAEDQLSKLTGTSVVCISMGFFALSLGINKESVCFSNMAALTIMVVGIIVNTGVQMYTGVIFIFILEHIMILCSMQILLVLLWFLTNEIKLEKRGDFVDRNRKILMKGKDSFLERLKSSYLYGYERNPQLFLCKHLGSTPVGMVCAFCLIIVSEAVFRALILQDMKFCGGESDYRWSTRIIVWTQLIFIIVGSVSICFRGFDLDWGAFKIHDGAGYLMKHNPLMAYSGRDLLGVIIQKSLFWMVRVIYFICIIPIVIIMCFQKRFGVLQPPKTKAMGDIHILMEENRRDPPRALIQLFSRTPQSAQSLTNQLKLREDQKVPFLSLILLVRIAVESMSYSCSQSILLAMYEAYDIIRFVDENVNSRSFLNKTKSKLAKAAWVSIKRQDYSGKYVSTFDESVWIIKEMIHTLPRNLVLEEVCIVVSCISDREPKSMVDFRDCLEQLFVQMLHEFLKQLPNAIFKDLTQSPIEEYEDRVKRALNFIYRIESLNTRVQWLFPDGGECSSMITTEVPVASTHCDIVVEGDEATMDERPLLGEIEI